MEGVDSSLHISTRPILFPSLLYMSDSLEAPATVHKSRTDYTPITLH